MNTTLHPVFPLGAVLFPDGLLPVRIFEPRYLDMVARCVRDDQPFIACLISRGEEAGRAEYHPFGTSAHIVDWDQGEDGLLHLRCVGERRARLSQATVAADGLNLAQVTWVDEAPVGAFPARHERLATALGNLVSDLGVEVAGEARLDDAGWVSGRLAELLPFDAALKQRLLEMDDPVARLDLIDESLPGIAAD